METLVRMYEHHAAREDTIVFPAWKLNFTEKQLDEALMSAKYHTEAFSLIEVRLDQNDRSPALQRLAKRLGENLRGGRKA